MAVFEAEAVNALHFFHLVFGSSSEALESRWMPRGGGGKAAAIKKPSPNGLFFSTSPRQKVEALYLNLSFLEEISRLVFPRLSVLRYPDLGLSLEAVRISFRDDHSRFPYLWNFSVEWIGAHVDGGMDGDTPLPDKPPFYGIFFMGIIQCAAMMARRHGTAASLSSAVTSMLHTLHRRLAEPGMTSLAAETDKVFLREVTRGTEEWSEPVEELYRQAFHFGVDLVTDSLSGKRPSRDDFLDSLEKLKAAVWKNLFDIGAPAGGVFSEKDDALILEVLTGVMKRWEMDYAPREHPPVQEQGEAADSAPGDDGSGDDDLDPTVVLDPMSAEPPAAPTADELLETVVIGPRGSRPPRSSRDRPAPSGKGAVSNMASGRTGKESSGQEPDAFPETVILSPPGGGRSAPGQSKDTETEPSPAEDPDDFPETMIISPSADGHPERRDGMGDDTPEPPPSSAGDEDMPETVVHGNSGVPPKPSGRRHGDPPGKKFPKGKDETNDDIISETVIIRPGGLHGNKEEE